MGLPTFDPGFSTARTRAAFSAERRVASMLEVEAALARAETAVGLLSPAVAAAIDRACAALPVNPEVLFAAAWETGTVVLPLIEALRATLEPDVARWVHFGATTQDIVDTALVLQAREGLDVLSIDLERIASRC